MERAISNKTSLCLDKIGRNEEGSDFIVLDKHEFTINEKLGEGTSCVAYSVTYCFDGVKKRGVLKELMPIEMQRNDDLSIKEQPFEIDRNTFEVKKQEFCNSYFRMNELYYERFGDDNFTNYHPQLLGLYSGNGTYYILSSISKGKSYDKIKNDESLTSLLRIMLAVSKGVGYYHKAGYLHLDVKDKNVFILDDVEDLIQFFDFDSLTEIGSSDAKQYPFSPYYGLNPQEYETGIVNEQTDFFFIGAMLLSRLLGRYVTNDDVSSVIGGDRINYSSLNFASDFSAEFTRELKIFFQKTLATSQFYRYSSIEQLLAQLQKLVDLSVGEKQYLISSPKWKPNIHSIGSRGKELAQMHEIIEQNGYCFVCGMGGMGKSELVKLYCSHIKYSKLYDIVLFVPYTGSLKSVVASLPFAGIDDKGSIDELFQEKNRLLHKQGPSTLIVVDNFNTAFDSSLKDVLPADKNSFKIIFTSRMKQEQENYQQMTYEIPPLSQNAFKNVFQKISEHSIEQSEEDTFALFCQKVQCNTLMMVLFAAVVKKTGISILQIITLIEENELSTLSETLFLENDDETKAYGKLQQHLLAVFSVAGLSKAELSILKNMTLVAPQIGIDIDDFINFCNDNIDKCDILSLINSCWIDNHGGRIYMHPLLSDMIYSNADIAFSEGYYNLERAIFDCMEGGEHISELSQNYALAKHLEKRDDDKESQVYIKSIIAELCINLSRKDEAEKYLESAFDEEVFAKNSDAYAYYLLSKAEFEEHLGSTERGIEAYKKLIEVFSKLPGEKDYGIIARMYASLGDCYEDEHEIALAYSSKNKAWQIVEEKLNDEEKKDQAVFILNLLSNLAEYAKEIEISFAEEVEINKKLNEYKCLVNGDIRNLADLGKNILFNFNSAQKVYKKVTDDFHELYGEGSFDYDEIKLYDFFYSEEFNNGNFEILKLKVKQAIEQAERIYGKNSERIGQILITAAEVFLFSDHMELVEKTVKKALDIFKNKKESYLYHSALALYAIVLLNCNKRKLAEDMVDQINFDLFKYKSDLVHLANTVAPILFHMGKTEKVEEMCQKLMSFNLEDIEKITPKLMQTVINMDKGDFSKAEEGIEEVRKLLKKYDDGPFKFSLLLICEVDASKLLLLKNSVQSALENIKNAIIKYECKVNNYIYLNSAYDVLSRAAKECGGDYSENEEIFDRWQNMLERQKAPQEAYLTFWNNKGAYLQDSGNYEEALICYKKMLKASPELIEVSESLSAIFCNNLGYLMFQTGEENEEQEEMMKRSVGFFSNYGLKNQYYLSALRNLCEYYMAHERYEELCKIGDEIDYKEMTCNITSGAILSFVYAAKMQIEDVDEHKDEILDIISYYRKNMDDISLLNILEWFGGILCEYYFLGEAEEVFDEMDRILKKENLTRSAQYAHLLNFYGCIEFRYDDYYTALKYFQRAKNLLDAISAQDDFFYEQIIENIKNAVDNL